MNHTQQADALYASIAHIEKKIATLNRNYESNMDPGTGVGLTGGAANQAVSLGGNLLSAERELATYYANLYPRRIVDYIRGGK
jgi:hypothetical protein